MLRALPVLVLLAACKDRPPPPAPQTPDRPAPVKVERPAEGAAQPATDDAGSPEVATEAGEVAEATEAPASAASIRPLLQARHAADLPGRAALEQHPDPEAALRWLADHDELMLVRARSLDLLGLWDTDENAAFLLAVATDTERHVKLRTAAILGLKRTELSTRNEVVEALFAIAADTEPRAAVEAIGALAPVASARPALESLAAREGLDATVSAALAEALD